MLITPIGKVLIISLARFSSTFEWRKVCFCFARALKISNNILKRKTTHEVSLCFPWFCDISLVIFQEMIRKATCFIFHQLTSKTRFATVSKKCDPGELTASLPHWYLEGSGGHTQTHSSGPLTAMLVAALPCCAAIFGDLNSHLFHLPKTAMKEWRTVVTMVHDAEFKMHRYIYTGMVRVNPAAWYIMFKTACDSLCTNSSHVLWIWWV